MPLGELDDALKLGDGCGFLETCELPLLFCLPMKKVLAGLAIAFAALGAGAQTAPPRRTVVLHAARDGLDDPAVATNAEALTAALHEMEAAQGVADELYARWAELTEKAG